MVFLWFHGDIKNTKAPGRRSPARPRRARWARWAPVLAAVFGEAEAAGGRGADAGCRCRGLGVGEIMGGKSWGNGWKAPKIHG